MMEKRQAVSRDAQRGAVLMIGMVMLLMLILVAVGVVRLSMRHTQIVNNEQVRTEATAAAHYALDFVLNSPSPAASSGYPGWVVYEGAGQTIYANQGTSQTADAADASSVAVTVSNLTCKRGRVLKNSELVKTIGGLKQVPAEDVSCIGAPKGPGGGTGGGSGGLLIVDPSIPGGIPTDDSLCGTVLWDMRARVAPAANPRLLTANTTVTQGVEVRETITTLDDACH
jgi:hypothetical protein